MLYREIIALCSEIHTKHINTVCGLNVEFVSVKLVVHIVTTGLLRVKLKLVGVVHRFVRVRLPWLALCPPSSVRIVHPLRTAVKHWQVIAGTLLAMATHSS